MGFSQVFLVGVQTYLISREKVYHVFIVGVLISLVWTWNVKRIAFHGWGQSLCYSLGAGVGSVVGLVLAMNLVRIGL